MNFYRKNPLFAIGVTFCALLVLGEFALIFERYSASRAAAKRLEQRRVDLESVSQLTPPPTREIAAAIEADLAKAQAALASMQNELKGRGAAAERIRDAKVPAARTDAFFELATYVEKTRDSARKHEVELRPEAARLGFAAYSNEGPAQEHIEPVFRQRQIAQYLTDALIEAKPRAILSIKRERTLSKADREARAQALANNETPPEISGEDGPDYFTIDPRVSARVNGFIDTIAFRYVFTSQTAAVRAFLNRLASFELPVLVREVEVDIASVEEAAIQAAPEETSPAPEAAATAALPVVAPSVVLTVEPPAPKPVAATTAKTSAANRARGPAAVPIVSKPLSKFTVTVEFIELVTPPPPPPAEGATPPNSGS